MPRKALSRASPVVKTWTIAVQKVKALKK